MMRVVTGLMVVVGLVILSGCGFHLRGEASLPESLKTMYLQGVNTQQGFGLELKRTLMRNGVTVLPDYQKGAAVLTILKQRINRRVLSVGSNAKVSEYELDGEVQYQVNDGAGKVVSQPQTLEAQRNYEFDQNQVLAMDEQESMLRHEIYQQIVQNILRRLSALK